ncbi:MAG: class I SAM-dependent methyltransferase [Cytophagales bacterium]|nr:class I SAM-dependent methyltransferase [Cytophagales bacterium]
MLVNTKTDISGLRKKVFTKFRNLDHELIDLVKDSPSNQFLLNPPIHNVYLYLIDLVCEYTKLHFDKNSEEIKVLDWGSGKGHISYLMSKKNFNLSSCDIKDSEAEDSSFGQATPILDKLGLNVDPLEHPYILPYDDESFDVVLSFGVLEHVPDDKNSIKEISRVLRSNGLFFCFHLPQPLSWTQKLAHLRGNYYHDRFYSKATISELSKLAHFEVLDVWQRALFPKNTINYPFFRLVEKLDQFLSNNTPLGNFATNIEFVARKI